MTFISKSPEGLMFCGNFWLPYGSQSSEKTFGAGWKIDVVAFWHLGTLAPARG
jgi:hypothetical protein